MQGSVTAVQRKCICLCTSEHRVLPEEGVVLNADLPQSLRGPVVGQLEAYGALKLFVLSERGKGVEVVEGWREVRKKKKKKRRVKEASAGRDGAVGGRVNCVYSAAMEKSMLFCLLVEMYSCISCCRVR